MISFILAAKDNSVCLDTQVPLIVFKFRTWLWIDGASTILFAFVFVMLIILRKKQSFLILLPLGILQTLSSFLKIIWVFIGIGIFLTLNFDDCSSNLIQFLSIYFMYVLYALLQAIIVIVIDYLQDKQDDKQQNKQTKDKK